MPRVATVLLALGALAATAHAVCQSGFFPYVAMSNGEAIQIDLSPLRDTSTPTDQNRTNYLAVAGDGTNIYFRIGGGIRPGQPIHVPTDACLPRAAGTSATLTPSACARVNGTACGNNTSCYAVYGDCDVTQQTLTLLDPTNQDGGVLLVQSTDTGNDLRVTLTCNMNAPTFLPATIPAAACAGGYCLSVETPYACSCNTRTSNLTLACEGYTTPCGGWSATCQPINQLHISSAITFSYFANPRASDPNGYVGSFTYTTGVFADGACTTQMATIARAGNWQDLGESQHTLGGRQISLLDPSITITSQSDLITQQLQLDCPCNGTWVTGVPRTLVYCGFQSACTLDVIGFYTVVGSDSYGVALTIAPQVGLKVTKLQLSEFSNTRASGFNNNITANSTLFTNTHTCSSAIYSTDVCGNFTNECHVSLRYHDVMYDSITFYAQSDSFVKVERAYDDADQNCQGAPTLESYISGSFQLLGDSDVINGGEKIQMTVTNATFTPNTLEFVALLNNLCPCGSTWQLGRTRQLIYCPIGTCDAGNLTTGGLNLLVGTNQPAYGNALRFGSQLLITPLSPDQSGFNNVLDAELFPWNLDGASVNDFCQVPNGGKTCQAGYFPYVQTTQGIARYDISPLQNVRSISLAPNFYAENADGTKQVYFRIGGTIRVGQSEVSLHIPSEDCLPRAVGYESVVNPMACEIKRYADCPNNVSLCYAVLGTCDDEDQSLSAIDLNNPDGGITLLSIAETDAKISRISIAMKCNMNAPAIPSTNFTLEQPCVVGGACILAFDTPYACSCATRNQSPDQSMHCDDFLPTCGTYSLQQCIQIHPSVWAKGTMDFNYYHSPIADPTNYVGSYSWQTTIYSDDACTNAIANMDREGNWQDLGASAVRGGRQIAMQDYTVSITPLSDDATVGLQTGCPCASGQETWGKNIQRVLTNCGVCRYDPLGLLTVGSPVYVITHVDVTAIELLRLGNFSTDPGVAFSSNLTDAAIKRSGDCNPAAPVNSNLCGKYSNKCHVSMATNRDILDDAIILDDTTNTFTKTETVYDPSDAFCQGGAALTSEIKGSYAITGQTAVFPDGSTVQFTIDSATFTPYTNLTKNRLNSQCPCGGMWKVGQTRSIATCPPMSCTPEALFGGLNFIVGTQSPAYGSIVRFGNSILLTQLSSDAKTGYTNAPSLISFPWSLESEDGYCKSAQPSSGGGSSSKGLSAGSALLISFFVILAVYIIGGVLYNHRRGYQGADLLPNRGFWMETTVLIKEGIFFSVCHCCGLFTSSSNYASLNNNRGGYGSL